MKVAIIAYGVEGKAALTYWRGLGADCTVCDAKIDTVVPDGVAAKLGDDYLAGLDAFDLIVRTPSVRPDKITAANPQAPDILEKVTSSIREFLGKCPAPVIGVTGTKGKGTTSTLIVKMLEAAGKKVWFGGNIGTSPLEFLDQIKPTDYAVLELSSFQLMDITKAPHISVCLLIAPDHLNWHTDMVEYIEAKSNIFSKQTAADVAVYFADNPDSTRIAQLSPGTKIPYFNPAGGWVDGDLVKVGEVTICRADEAGLIGRHNLQNICAALTAVWQITPDPKPLAEAIKAFTGLEHRIELVAEVAGVRYYDDSFSVQPEAAMAAIEAFAEPKVVILGGSDKGTPFEHLAEVVKAANIRKVMLVGATGPTIQKAFDEVGFSNYVQGPGTMPEIVETANKLAQKGDVVLLSPACASFDMFKDYKDRGNQFHAAVENLSVPK